MEDRLGLSKETLIVVVVLASVAGVAILYVFFKIARSVLRRASVPLPPIQPLAHHRLAKVDDRAPAWYPSVPVVALASTSNSSLLAHKQNSTSSPIVDATADDLLLPSPLSADQRLSLPNPSFHELSASSQSSFDLSEQDIPLPTFSPPSRSESTSRARSRRPRPLSASSLPSQGTHSSYWPNGQSVRGVPHAPHNQIQIILPAPLAPGLGSQSDVGHSSWASESRTSVVDKWIPVGRKSLGNASTASLLHHSPSPNRIPRRAASSPSRSPSSYKYSTLYQPETPALPPLYQAQYSQPKSVAAASSEYGDASEGSA